MAEIKIEKKTPIWPWILLLLGILAAIWFFFLRDKDVDVDADTDEVAMIEQDALLAVNENNAVVANYVTFMSADNEGMTLDHEYSHDALTKLTNAVDAMATETGFDVSADISKVKELADDIMVNPMETTHSDKIRKAADVLATAMHNLQQAKYPGLNAGADEVVNAAMAIDPKVLALDQKDNVKSFFRKSADLLQKMN